MTSILTSTKVVQIELKQSDGMFFGQVAAKLTLSYPLHGYAFDRQRVSPGLDKPWFPALTLTICAGSAPPAFESDKCVLYDMQCPFFLSQ